MPIWLTINSRSGVPIYVQLVDQIKHAVEVGALRPGEQLPTVRQLAAELTIAPNTIVKAYNELQAIGLIDSRPGAGTVVADNLNGGIRREQIRTLEKRLGDVVRDAAGLGIERAELEARFAKEVARFYRADESEAES